MVKNENKKLKINPTFKHKLSQLYEKNNIKEIYKPLNTIGSYSNSNNQIKKNVIKKNVIKKNVIKKKEINNTKDNNININTGQQKNKYFNENINIDYFIHFLLKEHIDRYNQMKNELYEVKNK